MTTSGKENHQVSDQENDGYKSHIYDHKRMWHLIVACFVIANITYQETKTRKSSSVACKKTLRRQSNELSKHREYISNGECSFQLHLEIVYLDIAHREYLLAQAELPVTVPAEQVLAMKVDLGFFRPKYES